LLVEAENTRSGDAGLLILDIEVDWVEKLRFKRIARLPRFSFPASWPPSLPASDL